MKFFYAIMVFFLSLYIFFWALVFVIPTPKNYRIGDILSDQESSKLVDTNTYTLAVEKAKKNNDDNIYIFEASTENKRNEALFLASILTFIIIFFQIIIFHKISHISFPMVAATVIAYLLYSLTWLFMSTLPSNLYIDISSIREQYKGFFALQFLGLYLIVFLIVLVIGNLYKLREIK